MPSMESALDKILVMMGIFRVEKKRWPFHAAELQSFAFGLGKPMDLSLFHRLTFDTQAHHQLTVHFTLLPEEGHLAPQGQAEIRLDLEEMEKDTLPLRVRLIPLDSQRVEPKSYCLI